MRLLHPSPLAARQHPHTCNWHQNWEPNKRLVPCTPQIIHDYEHKGVNNDYLVRVSDALALLYNDRSPMVGHGGGDGGG